MSPKDPQSEALASAADGQVRLVAGEKRSSRTDTQRRRVVGSRGAALPLDKPIHFTNNVWQMKPVLPLGQFEQLLLAAVLSLDDNAYGVTIHAKVKELAAPRPIALGAVYVTLDRLEDKGLVRSWLSAPTAMRGGRARRHYRLAVAGERALRESARALRRLHDTLEAAWGWR